jgi:hypothetical protein
LYPDPSAKTFVGSAFDKAAHEYLPHLPKHSAGAYMYIPLVAGLFAPLTHLGPNRSLAVWHALSVLSLFVSCYLLANRARTKPADTFFFAFLFLPVFLTLWGGQLGLVLGLLPLAIGYVLALRQRPVAAGLVWSLLLLKPQYFLAAAFTAIVLALARDYRAFIAMTSGVIGLIVLTLVSFGPELTLQWLLSHRVSDAMYSSGQQSIPSHLITGLPANLLILFPFELRSIVKLPLYAGAALVWLAGFIYTYKQAHSARPEARMTFAFVVGGCLCAITLPHLLYYDLCVLIPAGILLLGQHELLPSNSATKALTATAWLSISIFLVPILRYAASNVVGLVLELILVALVGALMWKLRPSLPARSV